MSLDKPRKTVRNSFVEAQDVSDDWPVVLRLETQLTLEPVTRMRAEQEQKDTTLTLRRTPNHPLLLQCRDDKWGLNIFGQSMG